MDNTKYECAECGWTGTDHEKAIINIDGWDCRACPKCQNEEFYIAKQEAKFELQKTAKGFLFLPMKGSDTAKFGGIGICDFCANYATEGKLILAINCYYCNDCFERWDRDARYYPEDSNYENRKAEYYLEILNNH